MVVSIGEPLRSDSSYSVHALPFENEEEGESAVPLRARLEFLESPTTLSVGNVKGVGGQFCIEHIAENDSLIKFYTGFYSYSLVLRFFDFLGPAAFSLNYWGDSERKSNRRRKQRSLSSLNQFFLTLIKLRLKLLERDLAFRFGISTALVSKFFITWVCFLYHQLKEIDWTPAPEQVAATLPQEFFDKYASTYSILDATEIFLQTPSDLQTQSSTWSNYKHHNTAKALIGCTPNGCVSFVSQLYMGSISDVELTRVSGYVDTLSSKHGISVMADRGFTIRDMLDKKNVSLNIPPFLDGRKQLSAEDIKKLLLYVSMWNVLLGGLKLFLF